MLEGIAPRVGPDLLELLAEMGHGDELVLADAHFPGLQPDRYNAQDRLDRCGPDPESPLPRRAGPPAALPLVRLRSDAGRAGPRVVPHVSDVGSK